MTPPLPEPLATGFVDPSGEAFRSLVEIMATLRAPDGCPWDAEQTHASLANHLLEETYEVLEAIDTDDGGALREELGDVLLQVIFHANIAFEDDGFSIADVCDDLRAKLIRRHPHVFGDTEVAGADEVKANWERIKADEKGRTGPFEGIPAALPALARAAKVQRRMAGPDVGLDVRRAIFTEEVEELLAEVDADGPDVDRVAEELGDVLYTAVVVANHFRIDSEAALRGTIHRTEQRYQRFLELTAGDGVDPESLSPEAWERYWERAKKEVDT